MPPISKTKKERIIEQILLYLYSIFPKQIFTSDIAKEVARDEEFIKKILMEMEKKDLIRRINKSPKGIKYSRRLRWRISNKIYNLYKSLSKKDTFNNN